VGEAGGSHGRGKFGRVPRRKGTGPAQGVAASESTLPPQRESVVRGQFGRLVGRRHIFLAYAADPAAIVGAWHGLNALAIFVVALLAGRRVPETAAAEDAPA
jgi:hypothetical protein